MLYLTNQLKETLLALLVFWHQLIVRFLLSLLVAMEGFQCGANFFTAKKAKHEFNASKFDLKRNTNDIFWVRCLL